VTDFRKEAPGLNYANVRMYLRLKRQRYTKDTVAALFLKCRRDVSFCDKFLSFFQGKTSDQTLLQVSFIQEKFVSSGEFHFSEIVWRKCKSTQSGRRFANTSWRAEVLHILKVHTNVCSFVFNRHVVKPLKCRRKNVPAFQCEGRCNFTTCPVTFKCQINEVLLGQARFQG